MTWPCADRPRPWTGPAPDGYPRRSLEWYAARARWRTLRSCRLEVSVSV